MLSVATPPRVRPHFRSRTEVMVVRSDEPGSAGASGAERRYRSPRHGSVQVPQAQGHQPVLLRAPSERLRELPGQRPHQVRGALVPPVAPGQRLQPRLPPVPLAPERPRHRAPGLLRRFPLGVPVEPGAGAAPPHGPRRPPLPHVWGARVPAPQPGGAGGRRPPAPPPLRPLGATRPRAPRAPPEPPPPRPSPPPHAVVHMGGGAPAPQGPRKPLGGRGNRDPPGPDDDKYGKRNPRGAPPRNRCGPRGAPRPPLLALALGGAFAALVLLLGALRSWGGAEGGGAEPALLPLPHLPVGH
ncbi:zinc finger protein-like 1 isoform X2 [Caloenas nicobarica]|uniref:zinc finger protein-like 1 isoform X2 n=1 Tax=Caloenas nicobarica TaxID=187106 RepID=UPI0032B74710